MFYDRYLKLCAAKGVTPSRAALEAGLSKSTVTKWKNDPDSLPSGTAMGKLSRYFGVSISELMNDLPQGSTDGSDFELPSEPIPAAAGSCDSAALVHFYDRFVDLCRRRGVTPSRAAIDAGLSKSTVTKWKNDPASRPTGNVLDKLTRYFGIPVSELLGEGTEEPRHATEEEIKFALFGGSGEITHEMYEEVRSFAAFVREREAAKRRKD